MCAGCHGKGHGATRPKLSLASNDSSAIGKGTFSHSVCVHLAVWVGILLQIANEFLVDWDKHQHSLWLEESDGGSNQNSNDRNVTVMQPWSNPVSEAINSTWPGTLLALRWLPSLALRAAMPDNANVHPGPIDRRWKASYPSGCSMHSPEWGVDRTMDSATPLRFFFSEGNIILLC